MSNVSIFEKKWIDLVFEGRNQEYGAYQLRQENPKTALMALLSALFCIATVSGMVLLLSSFSNKPIPVAPVLPPDIIIIVNNDFFDKIYDEKNYFVHFIYVFTYDFFVN